MAVPKKLKPDILIINICPKEKKLSRKFVPLFAMAAMQSKAFGLLGAGSSLGVSSMKPCMRRYIV